MSKQTDADKLADLAGRTYKEQSIWFLNSQFDEKDAEKLWSYVNLMAGLDLEKKAEGSGLDEAQAHRFLEKIGETLTVSAMREKLRTAGAIGAGKIKLVPLIHILIIKYNVDYKKLVNAPQGNKEEIRKAQAMLDEVQTAFRESEALAEEAKTALRESQARESEAKAKEAAAREQEAPFKAAQEEVDRALADVKSQETARDTKTEDLKRKSSEGGVVQQNKAKAELAQHLAQDPLPLSKAKITLEAALKKAEKSRAPFEAATKQAEAARAASEEARKKSEDATAQAEAALDEARKRVDEAEAYMEEAKNKGVPQGQIWWMERELEERKKFLPERKGGVKKISVV